MNSESSNWTEPKAQKVRKMFSEIAGNYDQANTVLSGGIHHLWRKKLVQLSQVQPGHSVLDCATGTGDLALAFAKAVQPNGLVVGTDFCPEMIEPAPAKAQKMNLNNVSFKTADVTDLPFEDQQFDISSISFGIRNVENLAKAIEELCRVVKPGGRVMILEFGQPRMPGFQQAYNFYSQKILPTIGGWVTGKKEAYEYLQDSSSHFPCREDFVAQMHAFGQFQNVTYTSLTGGIAYIYTAIKSTEDNQTEGYTAKKATL